MLEANAQGRNEEALRDGAKARAARVLERALHVDALRLGQHTQLDEDLLHPPWQCGVVARHFVEARSDLVGVARLRDARHVIIHRLVHLRAVVAALLRVRRLAKHAAAAIAHHSLLVAAAVPERAGDDRLVHLVIAKTGRVLSEPRAENHVLGVIPVVGRAPLAAWRRHC